MPKKAWSHLRSPSKEGRRAAADKGATRSFLPHPAETPAAAAAAAAAAVAVVSSDATSTTTTTTTDGHSCRHPPPPHTGNGDSDSGSSSSLGGALERSHAPRGGEKTDPIRTSPVEAARGGQEIAASPRGGATPGSPGGKRRTRGRSPTRVRHPRDPTSPETAYRSAVQGYLEPPKIAKGDATTPRGGGNTSSQSHSHRKTRSVSPAGRSVWCSPVRPDEPCAGAASASASTATAAPGSPGAALKEKVSPLLLAPSDWGIGLSGEWVPAHGGPRVVKAVGRVSLTWADIRGSTLLHLAAQHNDVALIKAVLECEKRRKKALQAAERRKERVLARARKRAERSQNEIASRRPDISSPTSKEVSRQIKKNQAAQKKTAAGDRVGAPPLESDDDRSVDGKTPPAVASTDNGHIASGDWLPLEVSDGGGDGKGRGAVVVNKIRSVLEEAHVRKVARLAGFYLTGAVNEADWYHRTDTILPIAESRQLLVEIAAAHPSDTWERRAGKAAIQDYAEEERSKADGGFWMDKGIKDALDLNARNQPGETPLILGAQNGSLECVAALLEEADTDVTAANGDGCTALVMAAMLDKTGMVKVLVAAHSSRGVGVNHRTANGYSALHWAVVRGNLDAAIDLVDAAASVNTGRTDRRQGLWRLPIHKCAEYGSTKCFLVLLKAGADPLMEDNLGMTPMHIAARKGFVEIMRCLSEGEHAAVSVNVVSKKNGKTPLHYSVEHLQLESARYILDSAEGKAEGIKHLDGSQRAKLETMLAAAEKEKRGVVASAAASFSEFVHKVFL